MVCIMQAAVAMPTPDRLVPSVRPSRRRRSQQVVLVAIGAATACGAVLLAARPDAPSARREPPRAPAVTTIAVPSVVLAPLVVPVPAPVRVRRPGEDLGPCPRRFRAATPVAVSDPPEPVHSVAAASHDVRLLAAWNNDHVFLSTDEGRTFRRMLDRAGFVRDVAFDCHGRLYVLRLGGWLGVHDPAAAPNEAWTALDEFRIPDADGDVAYDARLVMDRVLVAVIGVDPTERTRLLIARVDRRGRWRATTLFQDRSGAAWDGAEVHRLDPPAHGRVRVIVLTAEGGDGGDFRYHEVVAELRRPTVRSRDLGQELPAWSDPADGVPLADPVLDAAGRWVGIPPVPDRPRLLRIPSE